jgi:hypothetical protein
MTQPRSKVHMVGRTTLGGFTLTLCGRQMYPQTIYTYDASDVECSTCKTRLDGVNDLNEAQNVKGLLDWLDSLLHGNLWVGRNVR